MQQVVPSHTSFSPTALLKASNKLQASLNIYGSLLTFKGSFFIQIKDKTWVRISTSSSICIEYTAKEEFLLVVRSSINIDDEILTKYKSLAKPEYKFVLKSEINVRYTSLLDSGIPIENAEKEIEYPSIEWQAPVNEFEMIVIT